MYADWKIQEVMKLGKCDRFDAISYLDAENGCVVNAVKSLRLDRMKP